jgi:poly-gamma-glutamate synthase PgsB/CapB
MIYLFALYATGCALLLVAGIIEQRRHHRYLHGIPHRIVVNGTRGKSSITRLCAGALRSGGLVTVAKSTGTAARLITPDGHEEPVYRKFGLANLVEQIGIVRRAAAYRPDALVIECMAVLPDLQEVNERKLIRSTICVISNVREDHLSEMGPTLDDVARALSRSMPTGGTCVTAERDRMPVLRDEAGRRSTALIPIDPESVTDEEIRRFPYIAFKENVAIALAVAGLAGVDRATALAGMITAPPDPGTVTVTAYRAGSRRIAFANIFAANDPASTRMNIELLVERDLIRAPLNVVINCRSDRIERNGQMGELTDLLSPDRILLIGGPTRSAKVAVPARLVDRVCDLGGPLDFPALLDALVTDADGGGSLVAIGSIHGQGEVLLERLCELPLAVPPDVQPVPHGPIRHLPAPRDRTRRFGRRPPAGSGPLVSAAPKSPARNT